jgi:hypothetical protein
VGFPFVNGVSAVDFIKVSDFGQDLCQVVSIPIDSQGNVFSSVNLAPIMLVLRGIGPKHLERENALKPKASAQFLGFNVAEKANVYSEVWHG